MEVGLWVGGKLEVSFRSGRVNNGQVVVACLPMPAVSDRPLPAWPVRLARPQSEFGDIYRVTLDYEGEQVKGEAL